MVEKIMQLIASSSKLFFVGGAFFMLTALPDTTTGLVIGIVLSLLTLSTQPPAILFQVALLGLATFVKIRKVMELKRRYKDDLEMEIIRRVNEINAGKAYVEPKYNDYEQEFSEKKFLKDAGMGHVATKDIKVAASVAKDMKPVSSEKKKQLSARSEDIEYEEPFTWE